MVIYFLDDLKAKQSSWW